MSKINFQFMERAIELARNGMLSGEGGPFGCIVVKNGEIISEGWNRVIATNDPTAHAEIVAIRNACQVLRSFQLEGCEIYSTCEPCPMCFGAIYWARPLAVYIATTRFDAAQAGFDDSYIYQEICQTDLEKRKIPFHFLELANAKALFDEWKAKEDKTPY